MSYTRSMPLSLEGHGEIKYTFYSTGNNIYFIICEEKGKEEPRQMVQLYSPECKEDLLEVNK